MRAPGSSRLIWYRTPSFLPVSGWFVGIFGRKSFLHDVHHHLYAEFLCFAALAWSLGFLLLCAHRPGSRRWRPAAHGPSDSRRHLLTGETRVGLFTIWSDRDCRTFRRPDTWRLDHRQLFVALDFYINLPVGLIALVLGIQVDRRSGVHYPQPRSITEASTILASACFALGVGALQILLDKGQEDDWFGSNFHCCS